MTNNILPDRSRARGSTGREAQQNKTQQRGRGNQQDFSDVRRVIGRVDDEETREALLAILSELECGRGQPDQR